MPRERSRRNTLSSDNEQKRAGVCLTCGIVKTHDTTSSWLGQRKPRTEKNTVYKGICLKCNTLFDAKNILGEDARPADMQSGGPGQNNGLDRQNGHRRLHSGTNNIGGGQNAGAHNNDTGRPGFSGGGQNTGAYNNNAGSQGLQADGRKLHVTFALPNDSDQRPDAFADSQTTALFNATGVGDDFSCLTSYADEFEGGIEPTVSEEVSIEVADGGGVGDSNVSGDDRGSARGSASGSVDAERGNALEPPPHRVQHSNSVSNSKAMNALSEMVKSGNCLKILNYVKRNPSLLPPAVILALQGFRESLPTAHGIVSRRHSTAGSNGGRREARLILKDGAWVKVFSRVMSDHLDEKFIQLEAVRAMWAVAALAPLYASQCLDGVLSVAKALSRFPDWESLQQYGSGLLARLAMALRHAPKLIREKDWMVVERLMRNLSLPSAEGGVQEEALRALYLLSVGSPPRSSISAEAASHASSGVAFVEKMDQFAKESSATRDVLSAMRFHPQNTVVQIWATRLLWSIYPPGQTGDHCRLSCSENLIEYIKETMEKHQECLALHESAIALLSKITCWCEGEDLNVKACAPATVHSMLVHKNSWVIALHGCRCIYNLCARESTAMESRSVIGDSGGIEAIVAIMTTFPNHMPLQGEACSTLAALCVNSTSNKEAVVASGGIDRILSVFGDVAFNDKLSLSTKIRACTALTTIAVEPQLLVFIRTAGAFETIKKILSPAMASDERFINLRFVVQELLKLASTLSPITEGMSEGDVLQCLFSNFRLLENSEELVSLRQSNNRSPVWNGAVSDQVRKGATRALAMYPRSTEIHECSCKILACFYARSSDLSAEDTGELETILNALREHRDAPNVAEAACSAVKNFCVTRLPSLRSTSNNRVLKEILGRLLEEVLNSMEICHASPEVQIQASGAVWALCNTCEDVSSRIAVTNGIALLAEAMETVPTSRELQHNCFGVFWSFFGAHNVSTDMASQVVPVILNFFEVSENKDERDQWMAELAADILATLSQSQAFTTYFDDSFLCVITDCMLKYESSPLLQGSACKLLSNISLHFQLRNEIYACGGTIRLCSILSNFPSHSRVIEKALVTLSHVIFGSELDSLRDNEVTQLTKQAMDANADCAHIQFLGVTALWNLAERNEQLKRDIIHLGGVQAIADAMLRFPASERIQEQGIIALWSLASVESLMAEIGTHCLAPIVNGMAAHMTTPAICAHGLNALKCLSVESNNKHFLVGIDVVDLIISCMWFHSDNSRIQEIAMQTLSNLLADTHEVMKILQCDIDAILYAMHFHRKVKGIQEKAIVLLLNCSYSPSSYDLIRSQPNLQSLVHSAMIEFSDDFSERANQLLQILEECQ